ncbi:MAG: HAMP domain-containing histidine kinase [Myxococcales bacterium]|nr:MAG: HAMP domain-containing histidine kinase [Myxococcales bacterium]
MQAKVEQAAPSNTADENDPAEITIKVLWCPAQYVADMHGDEALDELAARAKLSRSDLEGQSSWISFRQVGEFLKGVRELTGSDESYMNACIYRIRDSYGPLRFIIWAASPDTILRLAARTLRLFSSVSKYEVLSEGRNSIRLKYTTSVKEHRLVCLSRQAQTAALPTLWGLPSAQINETKCVAWGDPCCDFELRWFRRTRRFTVALGGLLGLGLSALAVAWQPSLLPVVATVALSAFGIAAALAWEFRSTYQANLGVGNETQTALEQVAQDEAEARQEVMEFNRRQRQWTQMLEEQIQERTQAMQDVVGKIQRMREERVTSLRGFSHDLRNPLSVMRSNIEYLRDYAEKVPDGNDVLDDIDNATQKMELMLNELMNVASAETGMVNFVPERIDIAPLTDRLRRRMRALVHGRDIRVSVLASREAPAFITSDPLIIDRVLDNLMTNAAKYTESGSVVIEVGGSPEVFTVKISDTGRGIPNDKISKIFQPGGSDKSSRARNSFGVGMSVVVKLLSQIGGRLEVMSRAGQGTTFWAHFPHELRERSISSAPEGKDYDELLPVVVKIHPPSP